jgi:dihydrofolate reductase
MITMIAAIAENNALGKENRMIWHLPDDFKRFKNLTTGHPIIMGRKTFESLPGILPNRTHIVITRQNNYRQENCIVVHTIKEAIALIPEGENGFIIGGGEIYKLAMTIADKLEITQVDANFEADAFFPEIDLSEWDIVNKALHPIDERHKYSFTYKTYIRK